MISRLAPHSLCGNVSRVVHSLAYSVSLYTISRLLDRPRTFYIYPSSPYHRGTTRDNSPTLNHCESFYITRCSDIILFHWKDRRPRKFHMARMMKLEESLQFGNTCHITANDPPSPTSPTKTKDHPESHKCPCFGHIIDRLMHRCSKLCLRWHHFEGTQTISECASCQPTATLPPTSLPNQTRDLVPNKRAETSAPTSPIVQCKNSNYRTKSTASSKTSSSSNLEAWKMSLVLPFMDDPHSIVMEGQALHARR